MGGTRRALSSALRPLLAAGLFAVVSPALGALVLSPLATNLSYPVSVVSPMDGTGRIFIVELQGRIRIVDPVRGLLSEPFLDLTGQVATGAERGMWSLAFAPDYAASGVFFVTYAAPDDAALVLARYRVSQDPDRADPSSEEQLLSVKHPNTSHYGGGIQFAPDGSLFLSTGDGGDPGDPHRNAQNLSLLYGKILRLDPHATPGGPLAAPGNPFASDDNPMTRDEIWAFGLRNPWKFSFDRATGDLFIGDVGQQCWEEIDRVPAGSDGGENFGWPLREGPRCLLPDICAKAQECRPDPFTSPIVSYPHPTGCAITGGFVYHGSRIPFLQGAFLFGDYCGGRLWMAHPDGTASATGWSIESLLLLNDGVTGFGEDEDGEILLASGASGVVWRILPPAYPLFSDDFSDGDVSDWQERKGRWQADGLTLSTTSQKADIMAPFPGCKECTLSAVLQVPSGKTRASLIGWWKDSNSYTEVRLTGNPATLSIRRIEHGRASAESTVTLTGVETGAELRVAVTWTGQQYEVLTGAFAAPVLVLSTLPPDPGTIGFRVRRGGPEPAVFEELSVR